MGWTVAGTWQIAARVADVEVARNGVVGVRIAGTSLALYRTDSGRFRCLHDRCCHRGVPLSVGRVDGEHVVCAYHGWEFDGGGVCRRLPSNLDDEPIPTGARVRSYPVRLADGFLWVWMGPAKQLAPLQRWTSRGQGRTEHVSASCLLSRSSESAVEAAVDQLSHVTTELLGSAQDPPTPRALVQVRGTRTGLCWVIFPRSGDGTRAERSDSRPAVRVEVVPPNLVRAMWPRGGPRGIASLVRYFVPVEPDLTRLETVCGTWPGVPGRECTGQVGDRREPGGALGWLSSDAEFLTQPFAAGLECEVSGDGVVQSLRTLRDARGPKVVASDYLVNVVGRGA